MRTKIASDKLHALILNMEQNKFLFKISPFDFKFVDQRKLVFQICTKEQKHDPT